jgi:AraC-like DNA-binding protein
MAAFSAPLESVVAEPLSRLLKTVDDPVERRTLAPLAVEELVFRLLRSEAAAAMRGAIRSTDTGPITEAMRLMRKQAFRPLSVEGIARQVAMSPSHFAHRFRAVARMSPMRFVKEVRLDAARTLLLSQGVRASEVALRVGYESPAHFARDFKRRFGASPVRYAQRLR